MGVQQELRLTSNSDGDLFWMAGLYYGKEDVEAGKEANGLDGIIRGWLNTDYVQKGETYAAFVHTEWQMNDALRLSGGLRYTDDDKSYAGGSLVPNPPFGIYGTNLSVPLIGVPYFDSREFSEDNVSGKIGVDWTPNDDLLFYLTWNKGYKSGGFDGSTITDPSAFAPFFGEDLYAWEIGMKSTWADRRVQWNSAAFLYDFKNMQAEAQREVLPNTFESIRANVGEAEIWGIESELWLRPATGLDIKLGIAYLNTEITDWVVEGLDSPDPEVAADAQAELEAHLGNHVPDSPKWTVNGLVRYTMPLNSSMNLTVMADFNHVSDVFKNTSNDDYLKAPSYWLLNARVSLSSADGRWEASLWGKNLGDKFYYLERFDNFGPSWIYETPGVPRRYGLTLLYRWQ